MDRYFHTGRVVQDTFEIGGRIVGVRWSLPDFADPLRRALQAYLVDRESPAHFSIIVGDAVESGRPKHHFNSSLATGFATASPGRLMVAIVRGLDDIARWDTPSDLLRVKASLYVHDVDGGGAVLIDSRLGALEQDGEMTLRRRRLRRVDVPVVYIDTATNEVVVPPVELSVDTDLVDLAAEGGVDRNALPLFSGRLPVEHMVIAQGVTATSETPVQNGLAMVLTPPVPQLSRDRIAAAADWLSRISTSTMHPFAGPLAEALR